MTDTESQDPSPTPTSQPVKRRRRWPQVFTKPVPLAAGFSGQIKTTLRAEGCLDRRAFGRAIHYWTIQGAYLRAVARGDMRHNLDGSAAGVPDETARQEAQKLLDEQAARRAERQQREQERRLAMAEATGEPAPTAAAAPE
jgi:sRNA-binding protein